MANQKEEWKEELEDLFIGFAPDSDGYANEYNVYLKDELTEDNISWIKAFISKLLTEEREKAKVEALDNLEKGLVPRMQGMSYIFNGEGKHKGSMVRGGGVPLSEIKELIEKIKQ